MDLRQEGIWPEKKLSGEVLSSLSVWIEVKMICIWSSWCHLLLQENADGLPFWCSLTYPGCPRKRPLNGCNSSSVISYVVVEWTQRYSATFAAHSRSLWLGFREKFIRQWRQLCAHFNSHTLGDCGSVFTSMDSEQLLHQHSVFTGFSSVPEVSSGWALSSKQNLWG